MDWAAPSRRARPRPLPGFPLPRRSCDTGLSRTGPKPGDASPSCGTERQRAPEPQSPPGTGHAPRPREGGELRRAGLTAPPTRSKPQAARGWRRDARKPGKRFISPSRGPERSAPKERGQGMLEWKGISREFLDHPSRLRPAPPVATGQTPALRERARILPLNGTREPQSFPASPPAPFWPDLGLRGPLCLGASRAAPTSPNFLGSAVVPRGRTGRIYPRIHLGSTLKTETEGPEWFTHPTPRPQHTHLTNGETEAQRVGFEKGFSRFSGLHRLTCNLRPDRQSLIVIGGRKRAGLAKHLSLLGACLGFLPQA